MVSLEYIFLGNLNMPIALVKEVDFASCYLRLKEEGLMLFNQS